jgi:hypothetical protein
MNQYRKLLELAANSIGYVIEDYNLCGSAWIYKLNTDLNFDGEHPIFLWNPIESSNDAFDLQVELGLNVCVNESYTSVGGWSNSGDEIDVDHNGDKKAATRLAITMAAARYNEP